MELEVTVAAIAQSRYRLATMTWLKARSHWGRLKVCVLGVGLLESLGRYVI